MKRKLSLPQIVLLILFLAAAIYFGIRLVTNRSDGQLKASGTIEAVTVNISPELAGKVKEVLVEEGQAVKAGEALFRLDDTLLQAQQRAAMAGLDAAKSASQTAQAAYDSAQAQYQVTLAAAQAEDRTMRTQDWQGRTPSYFDEPKWYFSRAEQIQAAQAEVDAAQENLTSAQQGLDRVVADLGNSQFIDAEKRLAQARSAYLVALQVYGKAQSTGSGLSPDQLPIRLPPYVPGYRVRIGIAKKLPTNMELTNAAQDAYDAAKAELDSAQNAYDDLLSTEAADQVLKARAVVVVAQERFNVAQDRLHGLQTGADSPRVTAAAMVVQQAQAAAQQAQDAVAQAQANLDVLKAQIAKLTVYAPMDGVILARNIEPGEFVQPGGTALTMANLNQLTITVYVPEDRYGQIHLGQQASVRVDSFPDQTFTATVSLISDQAEFTPRNVQTVEGRSATVYAVKLKVSDPQANLKLGMPADVTFTAK
jgi:multidrug resistance efflux pump